MIVPVLVCIKFCDKRLQEDSVQPQVLPIEFYNNFTFWVLKKQLDVHKFEAISFELDGEQDMKFILRTSEIPCSQGNPPRTRILGNESYDEISNGSFVNFSEGDTMKAASPYVLANSRFTIKLQPENLEDNVTLYAFSNPFACSADGDKVHRSKHLISGHPFNFTRKNTSYFLNLTSDGFICGYWITYSPRPIKYRIYRDYQFYNYTYFLKSPNTTPLPTEGALPFKTTINLTRSESQVCVLANLRLVNDDTYLLNITMTPIEPKQLEPKQKYLLYGVACFTSIGGIVFVLLLIVSVLVLMLLYYQCRVKTTAYYSGYYVL